MFVDTHCHLTLLDLTPYNGDLDQALAQAREAGVSKFMSISVDLDDHIELAKIAARHPDVGYTVGVHPCEDAATMARATTEYLVELAQPEKVWRWVKRGSIIITAPILLPSKRLFCPSYSCLTNCENLSLCIPVLPSMTRLILFVQRNLPMAFCTVLPKTGKPLKLF